MEDDDDKTWVRSPPDTCCPPSTVFGVTTSPLPSTFDLLTPPSSLLSTPSIYVMLTLKKFVEYNPLKDLIFHAYELTLINFNGKSFVNYCSYVPQYIGPTKQKKKIIRFSRNLEQVHYTPTHYIILPPPPSTRRRMSNSIHLKADDKLYRDQGIKNHSDSYDKYWLGLKNKSSLLENLICPSIVKEMVLWSDMPILLPMSKDVVNCTIPFYGAWLCSKNFSLPHETKKRNNKLNRWKNTLQKVLEIIEAGHCCMAFPKEDYLRVTT
ncbi:10223_t:CDS:2, partial [Scutellospora calospora]